MARVKLSEHKAKQLLFKELGLDFSAVRVTTSETMPLPKLSDKKQYVVKVDQGVKGRGKKGLIKLKTKKEELKTAIKDLEKQGYSQFIVEEMVPHEQDEEKYLSMERTREGIKVLYSKKGGVDIEEMKKEVKEVVLLPQFLITNDKLLNKSQNLNVKNVKKIASELEVSEDFVQILREFFDKYYVSFMEINPLVVKSNSKSEILDSKKALNIKSRKQIDSRLRGNDNASIEHRDNAIHILDLAIEVDSTAQFFVKDTWNEADIVTDQKRTEAEKAIKELNDNSQAALSFTVLNEEGLLWVLLSGGGASIVVADEAYNLGFGKELGNYGEYSGNPNEEETYLYTDYVIGQMLKSSRRRLMLIIGGGVANFTDIRVTFKGILKALEKNKEKLKKRGIKVFVRRGGPHQESGLSMMEEWLKANHMYGLVQGPQLPLHEIVREAIKSAK